VTKSPTFPHPIGLLLFNRFDYAKAGRFVIPKFVAYEAQRKFQGLSRGRRAMSLLGQAFRALF